jgi:hypothetical protein
MPDSQKRLVLQIIDEHGGRLVRKKRHLVFQFPTGQVLIVPKTPSDARVWRNSLSALKGFLGITREARGISSRVKRRRRVRTKQKPAAAQPIKGTPAILSSARRVWSGLEKDWTEAGDFEALMLAQGVRKMKRKSE